MPAHEHLSPQFHYQTVDLGGKPRHLIQALGRTGSQIGSMLWTNKGISNIIVAPEHQRKGVATAMWNEGQRLAGEQRSIPAPKHSPDRTDAGDAWARSVGGRLPRRLRDA